MEKITHDITLDFTRNVSYATVNIVQGDNSGRVIRTYFKNNGVNVPISSAEGDSATLFASVNGIVTALGTRCNIDDELNAVVIPVTSSLSSIAGNEHCEVRITSSNGIIHSAEFMINVHPLAATTDMPDVVETADIVETVESIEDTLTTLEGNVNSIISELSTIYHTIAWSFVAVFPEFKIHRFTIEARTTPTLFGTNGYFDFETTQYDNFDYTHDGMLIFRNNKLIDKVGYTIASIIDGTVTIGDNTYMSDINSGVRVMFLTTTFDNTDQIHVELFIKRNENMSSMTGTSIQLGVGVSSGSSQGISQGVTND